MKIKELTIVTFKDGRCFYMTQKQWDSYRWAVGPNGSPVVSQDYAANVKSVIGASQWRGR